MSGEASQNCPICQAEVGEIAADAGAIDEGAGGACGAGRNAMDVIDVDVQPIENGQRASAAGGDMTEFAGSEAQELVDREITAG